MTVKERKFVWYYLGKANGNASLAARLAGYRDEAVVGHRLLRKSYIRADIESRLERIAMSQEEVLMRISDRAASSGADFLNFGSQKSANHLPSLDLNKARKRGALGNIKKLKSKRTPGDNPQEITEVEIHDALPALALLAKYHGLLEEKKEEGVDAREAAQSLGDSGADYERYQRGDRGGTEEVSP